MTYHLPLEITREDHLWMARSTAVRGLLVTGETLDTLFAELPHVTQALYDASQVNGWVFAKDAPDAQLENIVWVFELPHPLLQTA